MQACPHCRVPLTEPGETPKEHAPDETELVTPKRSDVTQKCMGAPRKPTAREDYYTEYFCETARIDEDCLEKILKLKASYQDCLRVMEENLRCVLAIVESDADKAKWYAKRNYVQKLASLRRKRPRPIPMQSFDVEEWL